MKKCIPIICTLLMAILMVSACSSDPTGSEPNDPPEDNGPANQSPVAAASADAEMVTIGEKVTLDASSSSDPDGDNLSYEWELSVPDGSGANLSDAAAEGPTFTPDEPGDYVATLTVKDGNGESDDESVTVTAESDVIEISSDISSDMTLLADNIYLVTAAIDVESSATLTLEAGVTVKFEENTGIRINSDNAALVANGTETDSVKLTGVEQTAGYWRGINFNSDNPSNKLAYTIVEYGGYESWSYIDKPANISLRDSGSDVVINNSAIRHSGGLGLYVESGSSLRDFSSNTFKMNEIPVGIPTTAMGDLDGNSAYGGNTNDYVLVEAEDVGDDMSIAMLDVPYHVENDPVIEGDAQVTVEPGVTIEFAANAGIRVNSDNAALIVAGSELKPVTFTGAEKTAGFWRGLAFDSSNPNNKLNHAIVEYGGYENWTYIDKAANVSLRDQGTNVTITNSTFRHSKEFGLYAEASTRLPDFYGNTFTQNNVAMAIPTRLMGAPDGASSYVGNTNDYVLVEAQDVNEDMTISALDVPYRIENDPVIESDAQVTIEAGTTLEFKANAGIRVNANNAALIVEGTSEKKVTFTGVEKTAGYWRGLAIDSDNPNNKIDHAIVEYGGYENWTYIDEPANVAIRDGSNLTLTNTVMRGSGGYGSWADDGMSASISFGGNTYDNNAISANNFGDSGN